MPCLMTIARRFVFKQQYKGYQYCKNERVNRCRSFLIIMCPSLLYPAFSMLDLFLSVRVRGQFVIYLLDQAMNRWIYTYHYASRVFYWFVCLFMDAVNFFFKMHLVLHLCFDSFHISQISSLGGPTFGLCSAWRYGDFCDLATFLIFQGKMVLYIRPL